MRALGLEPKMEESQKTISDADDDCSSTIENGEFFKMTTPTILNRSPKNEILMAFRFSDDDETGNISFNNLKRVATEIVDGMPDKELRYMIDEADREGDGEVNKDVALSGV